MPEGFYRKFEVRRVDGTDAPGGKHEGCTYLVLDLDHDPEGREAALAYADLVSENRPELAADLRRIVQSIKEKEGE